MKQSPTHILKFGGTSLQSAAFIKQAVRIVIDRSQSARPFVVVSALEGVTDTLIALAEAPREAGQQIDRLQQKHLDMFDRLVEADRYGRHRDQLGSLMEELRQTVRDEDFQRQDRRAWKDRILSVGERASALIFAAALSERGLEAEAFEAHQFIKTDSTFGQAKVHPAATRKLARKFLNRQKATAVITGFIGSDTRKRITTLGRSGSDYTAGLIADALDADHLEIWTDVNGVLTADPKWVPTARPIEELSFTDIGELSAHGAKVIHPKTIRPINNKNTTVLVKNSYNPSHPGTRINAGHQSNGSFKTITVTGPFVWLQVEDQHARDLLEKLTGVLENEMDPDAIAFHRSSSVEPARFLIRQPLFAKIREQIDRWAGKRNISLHAKENIYKVKKFSNHFRESEQLTRQIWNLLASKSLRPLHITRNSDERFISFLFEEEEARRAARLLNDYLQHRQTTIDLFVAGTGAVGHTLLSQLITADTEDLHFRLLGTCNSRHALWDDQGLDLVPGTGDVDLNWSNADETDWDALVGKLTEPFRHNIIFVDATGSEEVARLYPRLFASGIHVVTPSKLANTFEQSFFDGLQSAAKKNNATFRYETTVGAGLPVISTLEDLQNGKDTIQKISGVVSGTMTYLFNQLEQGIPFSKAITRARELGYAEPDPRDDLSGEDVARKFLILARTLQLKIEREELQVESLIPRKLANVPRSAFITRLKKQDRYWEKRMLEARENNKTLRYTGQLADGKISIGIETVSMDSPVGLLRGTDNLIQIFSKFYSQTPLVIQGPGAGKEVTAAGVLSDIMKTAKGLT